MTTTRAARGLEEPPAPAGVAAVIAEIRAEIAACRLCPGLRPHAQRPQPSSGTTRTGYMLVGEAARRRERPFEGTRGGLLRDALRDLGDPRYRDLEDLFHLADAVRCVPPAPKGARGPRAPSPSECRQCRPFLQLEIRALRPRLILAVGARAAEAVAGGPVKLAETHGRRQRVRDGQMIPLYLPSSARRAGIPEEGYRLWLKGLFGTLIEQIDL